MKTVVKNILSILIYTITLNLIYLNSPYTRRPEADVEKISSRQCWSTAVSLSTGVHNHTVA